jgi:hypothetical protein
MSNQINGAPLTVRQIATPQVRQSYEVFTSAKPRGSFDRPDFRTAEDFKHQQPEVVMRGPAQRPTFSNEQANQMQIDRQAAQQAAQPAISPEAFHALKVELKAEREANARLLLRVEQLEAAAGIEGDA